MSEFRDTQMPWYCAPGLATLLALFAAPAILMLLWNWQVVPLFALPALRYWQAFWLLLIVDVALAVHGTGRYLTEDRLHRHLRYVGNLLRRLGARDA